MREKVVQNIYYDREKKTYIVYFNYGKDPSGKYIRKTKTYKDIRTAKRELKNFEAEKVNQELIDPSSVTFKEYAEQWLKYKTASCEDTTIYGYSQFLNKHIYPFMGDMQLQSITSDTINDYIYFKTHCDKKDNPLSLNSIRKHYDLLKQLGQTKRPILLKRGLNATYEEWMMSAEYIMASGNPNVILCERGIRTFETYTRNTLDLQSIPVVRKLSHLPVVVDPSHAGGKWWLVDPMAKASVAAGADGLIIEVHNSPETALCDGAQSLKPEKYDTLLKEITGIAKAVGKEM